MRRKRQQWKDPGRVENWWKNALNGLMLEDEWVLNVRMSREDFMALEEQLRFNIRPNQSSFRGDTICSVKKLAMTLYYLKDQGSLRMMSNAYGVAPCTLSLKPGFHMIARSRNESQRVAMSRSKSQGVAILMT